MSLFDTVRMQREKIYEIAKRYGVENVRVFGSVARGEERPDSDIDFLVHMQEGKSAFDMIHFKHDVEELFSRHVDVVSDKGLHWYIKDRILNEAKPV